MFVISVKYFLQIALFPLLPITGLYSCNGHFSQGGNLWKKMPKCKLLASSKVIVVNCL